MQIAKAVRRVLWVADCSVIRPVGFRPAPFCYPETTFSRADRLMPTVFPSEDLLSAVSQNRLEDARDALARKGDPEFTRTQNTQLMIAAALGNDDMVQLLLEHGASANRANSAGWTALHEAARTGQTPAALRLAGAMWYNGMLDHQGWNAVRAAIDARQPDTALALLKCGVPGDAADESGVTPLMAAVDRRLVPVVTALLASGARPDAADAAGRTAMQRAEGWDEGVALLQAGPVAAVTAPVQASGSPSTAAPEGGLSQIRKRKIV